MKLRTTLITTTTLALLATAGCTAPDPSEIEHRTTGEESINPDGHESPIRVHDVDPVPELNVQSLLNVRNRTIALLPDGVAGLNYPDGTVGWIYRVPGHETTVDITTDSLVTVTHSVPALVHRADPGNSPEHRKRRNHLPR